MLCVRQSFGWSFEYWINRNSLTTKLFRTYCPMPGNLLKNMALHSPFHVGVPAKNMPRFVRLGWDGIKGTLLRFLSHPAPQPAARCHLLARSSVLYPTYCIIYSYLHIFAIKTYSRKTNSDRLSHVSFTGTSLAVPQFYWNAGNKWIIPCIKFQKKNVSCAKKDSHSLDHACFETAALGGWLLLRSRRSSALASKNDTDPNPSFCDWLWLYPELVSIVVRWDGAKSLKFGTRQARVSYKCKCVNPCWHVAWFDRWFQRLCCFWDLHVKLQLEEALKTFQRNMKCGHA